VDRRPGKEGETAFQNDRSRLSCLTNSLSDDFLKKGGKNRSEYEKASLERILAEVRFYFKAKRPPFSSDFVRKYFTQVSQTAGSKDRGPFFLRNVKFSLTTYLLVNKITSW
jgi:hypothetical protein